MRISVQGLSKSYFLDGAEIPVLVGIDLEIPSGALVSITGSSGVGKSTLLQVLGTLDQPTSGTLLFDGVDVFQKSAAGISRFRNDNIGFVFQFHHLLSEFTALENVMMPALIRRVPFAQAEMRASALLDEVQLSARLRHRPGELSGGEQQRVALARALMNEPKILLADEPTGNLDEATGAGIHEIIEKLNQDRQLTTLVVTHNPRLAARMPVQLRMRSAGIEFVQGASDVPPGAEAAAPN